MTGKRTSSMVANLQQSRPSNELATLQIHQRLFLEDIPEEKILIYDIETDDKYAPYAKLKMIGVQQGIWGEPFEIDTPARVKWFKKMLADPTVFKFSWNGKSFDDIVLARHGYPIAEENAHDLMLVAKAIVPGLASYSLKFVNWWYFGDPHFPEMALEEWAMKTRQDKWSGPPELIGPYCLHDIYQTCQTLRLFWNKMVRERWESYILDLSQGAPVLEMETEGGLYLQPVATLQEMIEDLQMQKLYWENQAYQRSNGRVENPNSTKQMGMYLVNNGFLEALSDEGEFSVPKTLILDMLDLENEENDKDSVVRCTYEVRKINSELKYFENYVAALHDNSEHLSRCWIPVQFSISNARTRRYTSNSKYGLNFQNPTKEAKAVHVVPPGYLGVWIDSTQVENVVHIYESQDYVRRLDYESNEEWNEYVWLCNRILGGSRTKKELDSIPSPQMPHWSIYKQFKTAKLALNFGMGVAKFCKTTGLNENAGRKIFAMVHDACPAIHQLQDRVADEMRRNGFVEDCFGHVYSAHAKKAYKVVSYLIQGCGTGSLPKAQIRANYDTLREYDGYVNGRLKGSLKSGVMTGTCHDENSLRIRLDVGKNTLFAMLQELMYNMTDRFSPNFDNIPLRAKLYLSRTTAGEAEEVDINDKAKVLSFCV